MAKSKHSIKGEPLPEKEIMIKSVSIRFPLDVYAAMKAWREKNPYYSFNHMVIEGVLKLIGTKGKPT